LPAGPDRLKFGRNPSGLKSRLVARRAWFNLASDGFSHLAPTSSKNACDEL
jgi:hypothetical protein